MPEPPFVPESGRLASIRHALRGLAEMLREEANARLHLAAGLAAVALGLVLGLGRAEWTAVILAIGLVWAAEALNTALEDLCDLVSPEFHPLVRRAKDVAAGGVLCAALAAAVVGLLVFGPALAEF